MEIAKLFKLFADETRIRILMLLTRKELCVCQMMGVLGISQPLISRNLSLLSDAGLLNERREGKLIFYSINKRLSPAAAKIMNLLKDQLRNNKTLMEDLDSLAECTEFQKRTGKCDMKTFLAFMKRQRKRRGRR